MTKHSLLALLSLTLATSSSFAVTLTLEGNNSVGGGLNGYGPYQTGVGGEFTFRINDSSLVSSYYSGAMNQASPYTSFQTFCVEGAEFISANSTYTASYNNHSVYSNVQLTKGAALLYSAFASGNWSSGPGYNYFGGGVAREADAALLQVAIWHFMGGQENHGAYDQYNKYEAWAASVFGDDAAANVAAATGENNVYVLNLWDSNGRAAQDQLIYTTGPIPNTVPDGGVTVILLGMSLTGLGFISRRVRR